MNNSRKIILDILCQVIDKEAYSNIVLSNELNKSNLKPEDRGLVTDVVYGTLKYKYTIDKIIDSFATQGLKKINTKVLNILRSAVYQIRYLDRIPDFAAVNEAVELCKKLISPASGKFANAILRNYIRNKEDLKINFKDNIDEICFQYSFNRWMVELFVKQYGKNEAVNILSGLNSVPKVTCRVNTLKGDYESAYTKLNSLGYEIQEGYVCSEAIIIVKGQSIERNPLFRDGYLTVQDESAMLVAPTMDLEEDMVVFDLCSAPGGKATHAGEIMNNTGSVYAYDIHENKLSLIESNVERLGLKNIHCGVMDASAYRDDLKDSADRVLIDVPCSGLGIIRKKPEIKWSKTQKQLKDIVSIQRSIMDNASRYVKIGGKLIYSTCTLNKSENEDNIKWFLKNYNNYKIEPLAMGKSDNILYNENGWATILPNDSMDGFFIAKFIRIK